MATILSMRPSVLLLDEPTAGLDGHAVDRVVAVLSSLSAAQVVISQDPSFLAIATRRRLVLRDGRTTDG